MGQKTLHLPKSHGHTQLQHLPNELLSTIVAYLDNASLCRLSLTSKRLREICQRGFFRSLILPEGSKQIQKLIETLVDRPSLGELIDSIELGDYSRVRCDSTQASTEEEEEGAKLDNGLVLKCRTKIKRDMGADVWRSIFLPDSEPLHQTKRAFSLAMLIALAPRLRAMSFELLPLSSAAHLSSLQPGHGLIPHQCQSPFGTAASRLLKDKLKVLSITELPPGKGVYLHNIRIRQLSHLRRLSVPLQAFVSSNTKIAIPDSVLPKDLEVLELRGCDNRFLYDWLIKLGEVSLINTRGKSLTRLRKLDLYFNSCFRSALFLLFYEEESRKVGRRLTLDGLAHQKNNQGFEMNAYTMARGASGQSIDIAMEQNSFVSMTPDERMITSYKSLEFSQVVARDRNGEPRARSQFEITLLRKFLHMPLALFTSRTFEPLAWSGVRMFNGDERRPARVRSSSASRHQSQRQKEDIQCDEKQTESKKKPGMNAAMRDIRIIVKSTSGFDAEMWFGERFFETSSSGPATTLHVGKQKKMQRKSPPPTSLPIRKAHRSESPRKHCTSALALLTADNETKKRMDVLEKARAWKLPLKMAQEDVSLQ